MKQNFSQLLVMIKGWLQVRGWRRWLVEALILILFLFAIRLYQHRDVYQGEVQHLSGVLLDQSQFDIQQLKGQPFLLHFWASWCPVCRLEEGSIDALAKDYPVITVASWSDDVASYMEENKLSFPVLSDPDGDLAAVYGIKGVPASFFVDAQGRIQFVEIGYTSEIGFRLRLWWLQL